MLRALLFRCSREIAARDLGAPRRSEPVPLVRGVRFDSRRGSAVRPWTVYGPQSSIGRGHSSAPRRLPASTRRRFPVRLALGRSLVLQVAQASVEGRAGFALARNAPETSRRRLLAESPTPETSRKLLRDV